MTFDLFKGFPPNRESPVVELTVSHDGVVDIPVEIYRENGELRVAIFGRKDGVALEYPLSEFLDAIQRAIKTLGNE